VTGVCLKLRVIMMMAVSQQRQHFDDIKVRKLEECAWVGEREWGLRYMESSTVVTVGGSLYSADASK
jgi:hypothetical protein